MARKVGPRRAMPGKWSEDVKKSRKRRGDNGSSGIAFRMNSGRCFTTSNQPSRGRAMSDESPPTRHKFAHEWDEIKYLYYKLIYWFYGRKDRRRPLQYGGRWEELLRAVSASHEAIRGEECW